MLPEQSRGLIGIVSELIIPEIDTAGAGATGIVAFIERVLEKGLGWPLSADMDDAQLEGLLYVLAAARARYAQPDYAVIHQELKRHGVTLRRLWEEHVQVHVEQAYRYSQFCVHYHEYRANARTLDASGAPGPARKCSSTTAVTPSR